MQRLVAFVSLALLSWCLYAQTSTVWDGAYSEEQATRGKSVYNQECARCHSETLGGGEDSPALVGKEFMEKWHGKTVGDLFERTRKTMPTDGPNTLTRKQYADVIAYLLRANEFPSGQKVIGTDLASMQQIRIEPKK
ncbi:MAG TPA: cytochrome c [Bryobacteraceae bacterium]|nr:cytochrome c [Bryobacteraceae bacterium]